MALPVSFFKVDQDNSPRCKYLGKLFDFSWVSAVRQISSSEMTILEKKGEWKHTDSINYSLLTHRFTACSSIVLKRVKEQVSGRNVCKKATKENNTCSQNKKNKILLWVKPEQIELSTQTTETVQPKLTAVALICLGLGYFLKFPKVLTSLS